MSRKRSGKSGVRDPYVRRPHRRRHILSGRLVRFFHRWHAFLEAARTNSSSAVQDQRDCEGFFWNFPLPIVTGKFASRMWAA